MKRTLKYLYAIRDKLRETVLVDPEEIVDKLVFFHDKNGLIHFPVGTDGRMPVRNIPLESDLIIYKRKCTNDGSNAGAHSVKLEPTADSIVLIFFAGSKNMDAAAVDNYALLYTPGASGIAWLWNITALAAGSLAIFPRSPTATTHIGICSSPSLILTDNLEIKLNTASVAVSEDTEFYIQYQYIGTAPTITETGPTGAVWSDIS